MRNEPCPTSDQLRAFSVGSLPHELIHEIAEHLPKCKKCEQHIRRYDEHADKLVHSLQALSPHDIVANALTATDEQLGDSKSTAQDDDSLLLDPGKIYSARLANGQVRLNKFILQSELGAGSFGYVFLARDTELDRQVAIKIQRTANYANTEEIQRFFREARNAARLKHPSIVSIYETGQTEEGVCYLVSEYVQGETLQSKLRSESVGFRKAAEFLLEHPFPMVGPTGYHKKGSCHLALFSIVAFTPADKQTDAIVNRMILIHRNKDRHTGFRQQLLGFFQCITAQTISEY